MGYSWPDGTLGIYVITRGDAGYGEAAGFVVAAIDEESARMIIADEDEAHGDEGPAPWLDSRRSSAVMTGRSLPGDPPRIILRDFRAG
jgi:hypothetical protein